MMKKYWKIAAAAAFLTAAGFCYGILRGTPEGTYEPGAGKYREMENVILTEEAENPGPAQGLPVENETEKARADTSAAGGSGQDGAEAGGAETSGPVCYVHICGEVQNPGVYELEEGSRIFHAVEAAGGMTEEAAADCINLAAPVLDGMRVQIPGQKEVSGLTEQERNELLNRYVQSAPGTSGGPFISAPGQAAGAAGARVNINTAGVEELTGLNGIGKARAEDVIRYRTEHGGFQSIEEIMNIPGIKDALFQKIKDSITV